MISISNAMKPIDIALDAPLLLGGITYYHSWDYTSLPHMLVFGSTGSGKTYFVRLPLARISLYLSDASVTLCDFKADDFKFCRGLPNYYEFTNCADGLQRFYDEFEQRQRGQDMSRSFKLLLFDEWASFLNMLDKKNAEATRTKLSTLLMLGRSFNVHVLISQQRADADYFAKSRDNFSIVIGLGNISKESAAMFNFDRNNMTTVMGRGYGYMLSSGTNMKAIKVPTVRDHMKVERYIRKVVSQ